MTNTSPDVRTPWPGEAGFADQLGLLDRQVNEWIDAVRTAEASLRHLATMNAGPAETVPSDVADPAPSKDVPAARVEPEVPSQASGPAIAGEPGSDGQHGSTADPPSRVDDGSDEALLKSLNRETLRRIRLRQRMTPGRSIRELLAELQASNRKDKGGPHKE